MELAYPWFLIGLISVAVPVIIHLLQLRRPQRLLFTNTQIIREVELVTVRHRKVQQLLILLARVLGLMGLALVFCQPFIPARKTGVTGSRSVNIMLDNSFSMQIPAASNQGTLFEDAVSRAKGLGQSVGGGGRFRLIGSGNVLMTQTAFQNRLDAMRLSSQASLSLGDGDKDGNPLYVFSDFQKNKFNSGVIKQIGGNGREVVLTPIAGRSSANVYVDSVWLDDAFVRVNANVNLHVRLRNGGNVAVSDCPVKVYLGGRQIAAFQASVRPAETTASVIQVQVNDSKLALGRVVTEDVPVTFDNTYYFTLQPAVDINVLEVGSEPLTKSLYENESLFTYSFVRPQNVNYALMRQANLVLVREVATIDAGMRDALQGVVKRGGTVVVVPTAQEAGHESYQQLFRGLGLGTVQWEAKTATPELREVAVPNAQEPFFRDVFGAQQRAVTMPRVAPVLQWSRTGTDILRLRDGGSYLANFTSGAGRVYVFSAPFAKEYSDFATHVLFVPVMYRMGMLSYRSEQLPAYRLSQGTVALQVPAVVEATTESTGRADEAGFRLVKDSLTLIPVQRVTGQEVRLDLPVGMDAPGFYEVQRRGKVLTTLAFNASKQESELAAYSADELRQMVGSNQPNIQVVDGGPRGTGLAKFQAEQTGQPLWRYFLLLVLVCLLAETLLVRFGSRSVGAGKASLAV